MLFRAGNQFSLDTQHFYFNQFVLSNRLPVFIEIFEIIDSYEMIAQFGHKQRFWELHFAIIITGYSIHMETNESRREECLNIFTKALWLIAGMKDGQTLEDAQLLAKATLLQVRTVMLEGRKPSDQELIDKVLGPETEAE